MSKNIVEDLPARKHAPAAAPVKGRKATGSVEEGSEKKIRQAVYDIRYRARREDIDLKAAYAQYMSNSNLSQQERSAVRAKLFGKEGGGVKEQFTVGVDEWATDNVANALYKVFVENENIESEIELSYLNQLNEDDNKKYKVRVTDKNGKVYVRYADRAKITQLRQNPNIKSVEMTEHGDAYEGERKRGTDTAKAKGGGKLDPVGKEDADIDNDGDHDKNDKYLLKRRKAIGSAIKKRAGQKLKEDIVSETAKKQAVDNYKKGENGKTAVTVLPTDSAEDPSIKAARGGIYASFAHQSMLKTLAEKKALEEKKAEEKVEESTINTADCEKKPEEKKDMRGYYAKINIIKNKIRAMGAKNPIVMSDPDEVEKSWDKGKKDDAVKEERTAADPDMPRRMGGRMGGPKTKKPVPVEKPAGDMRPAPPKGENGPATEKRYNPFKDGRTPTSASHTTAP